MSVDARGFRAPPIAAPRALVARLPPGVQLFRADRVYGRDHLLHAAKLAARVIAQARARSADLPTESALYVAGERQIGKALALVGLAEGTTEIAALVWGAPAAFEQFAAREGWIRDDAVLEGDAGVLDAFGVTPMERSMLPRERWGDLILERVALVDVLKS